MGSEKLQRRKHIAKDRREGEESTHTLSLSLEVPASGQM